MLATAVAFAGSARMELEVGAGRVATADYWPGAVDKPAVLILHGFLQTRDFPTVRRLAEALADEGYSVLTPTLTLGVGRRLQSLACEAIHTHSMGDDVAELLAWTRWLNERAGREPVLIGHSAGGVQLAALLDAHRELPVTRAVLISLTYFTDVEGVASLAELRARADADLAVGGDAALHDYALNYCRRYVTTPAALLSYLAWDDQRLKQALLATSVPVTVIYGDHDKRIDMEWLDVLGEGGIEMRPVAGADHFFDLAHEFDLLDEVVAVTSGVDNG
jgi:pimeloyl-ACP methyl ester carboxylesterase